MVNWYPLFSQTGSEVVDLCEIHHLKPTMIFTTNVDESKYKWNDNIRTTASSIYAASHNDIVDYFMTRVDPENTLITLHGYLRIIPPEMCEKFDIYNGHPAPIRDYPELKGKDPQIRIWQNKEKYPIIGSVVHKVTAGVDEGEIVGHHSISNVATSEEDLFSQLKFTSLMAWNRFFKERLSEKD